MSRCSGLLAALAVALAAGAAGQEIPRPALDEMEPHVRRQLEAARSELDQMLQAPDATAEAAAGALGRMGQLYHAYDLVEPAEACYERAADRAPEDPRWHYYLGLLRQRSGRREESVQSLERALELAPDDAATILRLADQEREAGRLDRGEALYRRLLGRAEAEAAGLAGLGRLATARGDHAAAAAFFERALEAQPSATRLHYLLAIAYRRLGRIDEARRQIELQGGADVAFSDPLLAELSALASGAAVSLQRGYYAASGGFAEAAIEDYRRAVAADPTNPEARRSLAGALVDAGDHAAAIEQLRALLEIDPNPAGAHFSLAEALSASGDAAQALPHYRRAVELAPELRGFRLALARALTAAGRLDEAPTHLERLIELDPHDSEARIDLGELRLARGETAAAAAQFRAVRAGDATAGQRAIAHHGLARTLTAEGELEAAREELERALALAPDYRTARLGLAALLGRTGRFAAAAAEYRRALESQPDDAAARLGEATALLLAGDPAAAISRLEEGIETLPDSAELADTLARLLAAAPGEGLRDGARALAISEGLMARQPTVRHAETMAIALAENGRFAEAVEWQERVVAELAKLGEPALLAAAQGLLAGFRRGEPYRLR